MYSIPIWLAEEIYLDGIEERGRIYFDAEEIKRTNKAILLESTNSEQFWIPLSQLREYEE